MTVQRFMEMMKSPIVVNALAVGVLVAICAALLGVVLVLKRYSLIGHALADVGFASTSLALALSLPALAVSLPTLLAAAFCIMAYSQKKSASGDVAIGIASTTALALGVMITAMNKGFNADAYGYLFGSILSLGARDLWISLGLFILVAGIFILFYNRILLITMDETFARALGVNTTLYQFLISFLTALVVAVGMRMMGALLISSLILFPVMTARKLTRSFGGLVLCSACVSIICLLAGVCVSVLWNIPPGAAIVLCHIALMIPSGLIGRLRPRPAG